MAMASLAGLPAFLAYFFAALALCVVYLVAYTAITPNREFDLILKEHNATAAVALGMSLIGFVIPLASAIWHTAGMLDCLIWGVVALVAQLIAYGLAWIVHPDLGGAIRNNIMSAGLWVGFVSLAAGILSAASMSY